jgi:hypothetical protein
MTSLGTVGGSSWDDCKNFLSSSGRETVDCGSGSSGGNPAYA